jgi:hypothetical protein
MIQSNNMVMGTRITKHARFAHDGSSSDNFIHFTFLLKTALFSQVPFYLSIGIST